MSVKLLAAQSSTQNSAALSAFGTETKTMNVVSNGTTTSGVIKLQGSNDNTNWSDLATRTLTVAGNFSDKVTEKFDLYRVAITTIIGGGGTVDVYFSY